MCVLLQDLKAMSYSGCLRPRCCPICGHGTVQAALTSHVPCSSCVPSQVYYCLLVPCDAKADVCMQKACSRCLDEHVFAAHGLQQTLPQSHC